MTTAPMDPIETEPTAVPQEDPDTAPDIPDGDPDGGEEIPPSGDPATQPSEIPD